MQPKGSVRPCGAHTGVGMAESWGEEDSPHSALSLLDWGKQALMDGSVRVMILVQENRSLEPENPLPHETETQAYTH